ncbi:winged helix-turn-helix domain-containing protein [Rhizobium calliandrae]|uniref:Winged helix-turn-helix domain-containing protein n=1 Tax=Rhizobium calliandrae TaxID=1312182 RepID=A0ABT7KE68_9HYPH|nr:winged helix-turn-helix domain-containing protein [Rhizobium calliandrae]MDL2406837.1 winged helix-turn-helix domain-containing protein [Rhizobium calliandrae]
MEGSLYFGQFSIAPSRRSLVRDGKSVSLGSRAIDILLFLATDPGTVKSNSEIVRHVWPQTFVDEANLRVHMSALRKALGDNQSDPQFIVNLPGRGYTFIAPVEVRSEPGPSEVKPSETPSPVLNEPSSGIFGRDEVIESVSRQLARTRLVTVVGPGGIGKSTVARAVVSKCGSQTEVVWIDLSEVGKDDLVPTIVAGALGVASRSDNVIRAIASFLHERDILLVLDSCEHLVAGVAELVEKLLAQASGFKILATSREPLRADGERVHRLLPLGLSERDVTAEIALRSPAVRLFVEKADACLGGYKLTDDDAVHVIDICTRLDGIALAIELAAGRLETMGVAALSRSLSDGFRILTRGRRTAMARHQTLRATLDWSYLILSPAEQAALRQLSVLPGWFSAELGEVLIGGDEAGDLLASLVAKSLVVAAISTNDTLYRLLDTTRLYAGEKLRETGNRPKTIKCLAGHLVGVLEAAERELYTTTANGWSRDFATYVPPLRAALDWTLAAGGDQRLGVRLTIAALPLFFQQSMLDECLAAVSMAIKFLENDPGTDETSRMKLYSALGWPQLRSTDAPEYGFEAWSTTLRIAEKLGDVDHQLRAIWALWVDAINKGQPRAGAKMAERFVLLAAKSPDPTDSIIARRLRGANRHWIGQHEQANRDLTGMIADYSEISPERHAIRFQFDQNVAARTINARCLWVLGFEDEAFNEVETAVRYAKDIGHTLSLSNVLAEAACPLALLSGRYDLAANYIRDLRKHTKALSLDVWHTYADCFEAELKLHSGQYDECLAQLRPAMRVLRNQGFLLFQTIFLAVDAQATAGSRRPEEAQQVIGSAIAQCLSSGERWCLPELYRIHGNLHLQSSSRNAGSAAERCFGQAMRVATEDGAVAWQRRLSSEIQRDRVPLSLVARSH